MGKLLVIVEMVLWLLSTILITGAMTAGTVALFGPQAAYAGVVGFFACLCAFNLCFPLTTR